MISQLLMTFRLTRLYMPLYSALFPNMDV